MTIKQQGGIFGRNPTFNEVEVDSKLTTDGIRYDPTQDGGYGGAVFVRGGTAAGGLQGQLFGGIAFGSSDRISTAAIAAAQTGSNNDNVGLAFYTHSTNPQNDAATKAFDVTHTGNIAFPSGQGIDFSATSGTGTSELFSDYEEGSWSPSLSATSGSATISQAVGVYEKIGAMVRVGCRIECLVGTLSGNVSVTGLPYSSANITAGDVTTTPLFFENLATNSINVFGTVSSNSATISLRALTAAAATSGAFTQAYIRSSNPKTLIYFTATYRAA
jgi:hypothetical protein